MRKGLIPSALYVLPYSCRNFKRVLLVQFSALNIAHPSVEGCDVRSNRSHIHTFRTEDNAILSLIYRNFNRPVNDDVEASLVHRFTISLVSAGTSVHDQLVKLRVSDVIHVVGSARS